jgi:hypothetical protein
MGDTREEEEEHKVDLIRLVEQAEKSSRDLLRYERLSLYRGYRGLPKEVLNRQKSEVVKA